MNIDHKTNNTLVRNSIMNTTDFNSIVCTTLVSGVQYSSSFFCIQV